MGEAFGPFSVDPAQVAGLGGALFQELVNRLLAAETAAAGLAAVALRTSYQANVGDGGVDALLESARETEWIPAGESAWQFKAGDLGPASCAAELSGATYAHEILRRGGKYRLVLGKGMEAHLVEARETSLRQKGEELGFSASGDGFKVIDGNQLARWIEHYPALAVSRVLQGIGHDAIGFDSWKVRQVHQSTWITSADREELRTTVLAFLGQSSRLDLRIEGASGIGKTRGLLEAIRGSQYEPLVLYVGDADGLSYPLVSHLTLQQRSVVLVLDECTRRRHKLFTEQLEVGSQIRLITVGERDPSSPQYQPIGISKLPDDVIDKVLVANSPSLWPEARRVVVEYCDGNVRWALYLAKAILDNPKMSAAGLLDSAGLREYIVGTLAGDGDFFSVSALALFSRYGIDGEKRGELETIARGLDISVEKLEEASRILEEKGLATRHGRYRAVAPQPLAVLLATRGWEQMGDKILESLLPVLDAKMAERLFLRAADLGSSGPAAAALNRILGPEGPFSSLSSIAEERNSALLIQLAIIAPDTVTARLDALIGDATNEELYDVKSIRRDLVWTLEKLVWHRATFETAADLLLRLANSENETFSNNATGVWISLFSAMLPATAALPVDRLRYLERVLTDDSSTIRKIAIAAAAQALDEHGIVTVAGELQGGVVVEPRGTPRSADELWSYIRTAIGLLRARATDDVDADVREAAAKALIGAIHPILENLAIRDTLFEALAALPADAARRVWTEVNHLRALFDRVDTPEFTRATDSSHDVSDRRAGLDILAERLLPPGQADELEVLAHAHRWEWEDAELERKIVVVAQSLPPREATTSILRLLAEPTAPEASYELGVALHAVAASPEALASLSTLASARHVAGIVGYLYADLRQSPEAFDRFLDGEVGQSMDPATRLAITTRGPKTVAGWTRVLAIQEALPVYIGAPLLFGWHVDVEEERISALLTTWLPRIELQQDYNAAVDVTAMMLHRRPPLSQEMESKVAEMVRLRARFGELGQQSYDWVQLARRSLAQDASNLLLTLLRDLDAGSLFTFDGSGEQKLLQEAISAAGASSLGSVLEMVQGGSWRLQMGLRGWLTNAYPPADLIAWIGRDMDRGRLVASLCGVGDGPPSPVVQFLLANFGSDDQISSSLYGEFISGTWWGNESTRINTQIAQLNGWISDRSQPPGVRTWARRVTEGLKQRLDVVLQHEAEEDR